MAEVVGAAVYQITAEDGGFIKTVKSTKSGNVEMQKQFEMTDKTTKSLTASMSKLAVAISSALTVSALISQFKSATDVSREFQKSISNLSAISGATGDDLKFLSDAAKEFGSTTTLSASQAAEALKLVASSKPELLKMPAALKAVTKEAVTLAEAAGIDLPTAASALTSSLTQFNLGADESSRVINVLAAGAKEGSSEIADTVSVIKEAGGVAAGANLSFEDLNGAIQAMAKGAIVGSEAGTKLRNILAILEAQTNDRLKPSVVGLDGALNSLSQNGFEDTTKAVELFGRENFVAAQALIKNREEAGRVTDAITGTSEAYRQAETNVDNLDGSLLSLGSAYESLQIHIGELTENEMRAFTKSLTELFKALTGNEKALESWGGVIDDVAIAGQAVAFVIAGKLTSSLVAVTLQAYSYAKSATAATVTTNSLGQVIARTTVAANVSAIAMRGLSGAMALLGGPVGIAVIAAFSIYKLAGSFDGASKNSENLKKETDKLIGSISSLSEEQAKSAAIDQAGKELAIKEKIAKKQQEINSLNYDASSGGEGTKAVDFARSTREIKVLKEELKAVGQVSEAVEKHINDLNDALDMQAKSAADANDKLNAEEQARKLALAEEAAKKYAEAISGLEQQLAIASREALGMTKEAEALNDEFDAKKLLGGDASKEQIQSVIDLFGELREQQRKAESAASIGGAFSIGVSLEEKGQTLQDQLNANLISEQEYLAQKLAMEQTHSEQLSALAEDRFRRESEINDLTISSLDAIGMTATNVFSGILSGTMSAKEAVVAFAQTITNQLIGAIVNIGVEQLKNKVIGDSAAAAGVATAAAAGAKSAAVAKITGAAIAASYAKAAAMASLASFGANSVPASTAITSTVALSKGLALPGRKNGGSVLGGKMYQMGENNAPEILQTGAGLAVIPGDDGRVFNQNQLDQIGGNPGGGNMNITQTFNIDGTGDKELMSMLQKTAEQAADAIRAEYAQSMSDKKGVFFGATSMNYGNGNTSGRLT